MGVRTEPFINLLLAAIGQVRDATRGGQPLIWGATGVVEISALPVRIMLNGGDLRGLNADLPCTRPSGYGHHQGGSYNGGIEERPFEAPRPAHGSTHDGGDGVNAE